MRNHKTLYCPKSNYHIKDDNDVPKSWFDVLHALRKAANLSRDVQSPVPYFARKAIIFLWSAELLKVIFNYSFSNRIIYLCWGLPNKSKWRIVGFFKLLRLRLVLSLSDVVFVNDKITQSEIWQKFKVNSKIIPFFIDSEFYFYKKKDYSKRGLLVVGDKDRDEDRVLSLAKRGHNIQRVTRSEEVMNFYKNNPSENIKIHYRIGFRQLRDLYHDTTIVLLPIKDVNHAAGQTALLEAISTGCPVVINGIKSASIGADFESVFIPEENTILHFERCINQASQVFDHHNEVLFNSSILIRENFQLEKVAKIIATYIKAESG